MLLSIIIPMYNNEKYILDCLNSFKYEKDFEIILVNDGSTDNSIDICQNFQKDSKLNIKIIDNKNHGVSYSRNQGITLASGKYLMFVDSDDYLTNNWEKIFNILHNDENFDIYYFSSKLSLNASKLDLYRCILGLNKNINIAAPFSKVYKTSFLKNNNIYFKENVINGEDMLFNTETLYKCQKYKIINLSFYKYRHIIGTATKRFNDKIFDSEINFQNYLLQIFKENRDNPEIKEIINWCNEYHIINLINRICYINTYKNAKQYFKKFEMEPLKSIIKNGVFSNNRKKYLTIIFSLLKIKAYFIIYFIYRYKNLHINKDEIIDI